MPSTIQFASVETTENQKSNDRIEPAYLALRSVAGAADVSAIIHLLHERLGNERKAFFFRCLQSQKVARRLASRSCSLITHIREPYALEMTPQGVKLA